MKAIRAAGGTIVRADRVVAIVSTGHQTYITVAGVIEGDDRRISADHRIDGSPNEVASLLGWEIVNEKQA